MPPQRIKNPQRLEQMCIAEVFHHLRREVQLCNQLRHFETKSLLLRRRGIKSDELKAETSHYLDRLPPLLSEILRQQLTDLILSETQPELFGDICYSEDIVNNDCFIPQQPLVFQLLDILLNNQVRSIEFSDKDKGRLVGITTNSPIWPMIQRLHGLHRLVLTKEMFAKQPKARSFISSLVVHVTSNCSQLTELVLKDAVTDSSVLQAIGRNCRHLSKLDLSGSPVHCQDVIQLCVEPTPEGQEGGVQQDPTPLCQTLEVLVLSNTNVRARGACLLLQSLPNLTTFGDLTATVGGIKRYHYTCKNKNFRPLKLQHVYFRGTTSIKLHVLVEACPNLNSLNLGSNIQPIFTHLESLPFKLLRRLTVENLDQDDLMVALRLSPNLLRLKVDCVGVDVSAIAVFCPHLTELVLHKKPSKEMNHLTPADPSVVPRHFRELQTLRVLAPVSAAVGALLFRDAVKLRSVQMVRIRDVDDSVFEEWLSTNPLPEIETLMIRYIGLTRLSVDLLIDSCPKLTKLGEMGGWDIRSWECRRIKEAIRERNMLLDLVLYTSSASDIYEIFNDMSTEDDEDEDNIDQMIIDGAVEIDHMDWHV